MLALSGLAAFPAAIAVALTGCYAPEPLRLTQRRLALLPLLAAIGFGASAGVAFLVEFPTGFPFPETMPLARSALVFLAIGVNALVGAAWGTVLLLAMRFRLDAVRGGQAPRPYVLMSAALLLFPGFWGGSTLLEPYIGFRASALAGLGCALAACAIWLRNSSLAASAGARNVGLLALAAPLAGMVAFVLTGSFAAVDQTGAYGLTRALMVLLLAYAILRHQLLGLDIRVRWTIKQSTLAAIFVTVFFVGSEAAKEFVGGAANSAIVGIAAAGLMVFALNPLQRAAEGIANAAVPLPAVAAPAPQALERRVEVYRDSVRLAMRDHVLSREEQVKLARLADELGINAGRAVELMGEVEAEAGKPPVQGRARP